MNGQVPYCISRFSWELSLLPRPLQSVMFHAPDVSCSDAGYKTIRVLAWIALVVFVLGFPIGLAVWLRSHHKKGDLARPEWRAR